MSIETRVERLAREIEARHGKGKLFFVSVVCNGCGRIEEAETLAKLLPRITDWTIADYGGNDYCPTCKLRS